MVAMFSSNDVHHLDPARESKSSDIRHPTHSESGMHPSLYGYLISCNQRTTSSFCPSSVLELMGKTMDDLIFPKVRSQVDFQYLYPEFLSLYIGTLAVS